MKKEELKRYLETHCRGRTEAIGGETLRQDLSTAKAELQKAVNRLRREGVPVGSDRSGYFYARTAGEVYGTIRRLQEVVVENQDFQTLIGHYDGPDTLFYCDPPYHATEKYYQNIGEGVFRERDHIRLRDALLSIRGKFLLSYNDDAFIRELYDRSGIHIEPITRLNNIRQRFEANCRFHEVFISNYDTAERRCAAVQLTMFEKEGRCRSRRWWTVYGTSEDVQVLASTTMVSSFGAVWYDRSIKATNGKDGQ